MGAAFSVNNLDLFSEPVHFSFQKKTYFKTTCGGLVSIIQAILLLFYLYYLVDELVTRKIPVIVDSQNIFENPTNISFAKDKNFANLNVEFKYSEDNLIFYNAFGIKQNSLNQYIFLTNENKKYIDLEIQQVEIDETGREARRSLNYEPCRKFANYKEKFVSLLLDQMYCLNDAFEVSGFPGKPKSKSVEIKFKNCRNSTANQKGVVCYPDNLIKKFTKEIQFEWYFDNSIFNTTSIEIENVRTSNLEQKYWDILSDYTKKCTIPLGLDAIRLYNSYIPDFLFSGYKELDAVAIREFFTEISDMDFEGNLLQITLAKSDLQVVYERRYLDVFSQLATLGGMCDVLFLIGFIFVWHISREKFNEELVNTFYNISDPNSKGEAGQFGKLKALGLFGQINYEKLKDKKNEFEEYIRILYNFHRHQAIREFYNKYVNQQGQKAFNGAANDFLSNAALSSANKNEMDRKQKSKLNEKGEKLFDYGSDLKTTYGNLYLENFFNLKKIESMFSLPTSSEMLDYLLDFKTALEEENEILNNVETDNKQLKNNENNIQLNENSLLKDNEPKESKGQTVELNVLNTLNPNGNVNSNTFKRLKTENLENKKDFNKSDKNRRREDYEKRRVIAAYFHNKQNIDYFQILQLNFEKNENYLKYKILYDALKLSNDRMELSRTDFAKYLFDCTSYEIENNRDIEKFKYKKKLLLFHVAKQKLKIDFDIVNILKTIDQFNDFKEIIMDEDQAKLFDFAIKKISNKDFDKPNANNNENKNNNGNLNKKDKGKVKKTPNEEEDSGRKETENNLFYFDNREEYEEKMNIIRQTEEGLDEIFKECLESGPSPKHINLLNCIGINPDLIKEFEEMGYAVNNKDAYKEDHVKRAGKNFNNNELKLDDIYIFDQINEKFGDNQIN